MIAEHDGLLSDVKDQLDKIIRELQDVSEDEAAYYQSIKRMISVKQQEYDVLKQFNDFNRAIIAMTRMDFSHRLDVDNRKDLWAYMATSLNMLNEELGERVLSKEIVQLAMNQVVHFKPDWVIITTREGIVKFSSKNEMAGGLINYDEKNLIDKRIQNFFATNISFMTSPDNAMTEKMVYLVNADSTLLPVNLYVKELQSSYQDVFYYLYLITQVAENKE